MDSAGQLLIIEFEDKSQLDREIVFIPDIDLVKKAEFLKSHNLDLLICGAISRQFLQLITVSGLKVFPFMRGSIKKVLFAYDNDCLGEDSFFLPGCNAGRRKHNRKRGKF